MVEARYSRQSILRVFQPGEFKKIQDSTVTVVGIGGTGSMAADLFARTGVKKLVLIDRDYVSITNLHRQILYSDDDIGSPKVESASKRLSKVNPDVQIEAHNSTFDASNSESFVSDSDLVFDGTDNFTTRLIINDTCVKAAVPWIYTSAIETYGEVKAILPGVTSCLSCYVTMPAQRQPACAEVGVFPSVPNIVASFGFTLGIKVLAGKGVDGNLYFIDPWKGEMQNLAIRKNSDCRTCSKGEYDYLKPEFMSLGIDPLI